MMSLFFRCLVISFLLVACGGGSGQVGGTLENARGARLAPDAYLPRDAFLLLHADLDAIRNSPYGSALEKLVDAGKRTQEEGTEDRRLLELAERAVAGLAEVWIAAAQPVTPEAEPEGVILFRHRGDADVETWLRAAFPEMSESNVAGHRVFRKDEVRVTAVGGGWWLWAADETLFTQTLLGSGTAPLAEQPLVREPGETLRLSSSALWFALRGNGSSFDPGSNRTPAWMRDLATAGGSADFSDTTRIDLRGVFVTEHAAMFASEFLNAGLGDIRSSPGVVMFGAGPLLDAITVQARGTELSIHFTAPSAQVTSVVERLLALFEMGMASAAAPAVREGTP